MPFEKISADEAHNYRKDVANDVGVMAKGVPVSPEITRAAKWDDDAREARFVMSAEVPDRMGDIVVQEGLDTANFEANPQALLFHNSRSWPIGSWKDVQKVTGGRPKRTEGTMKLMPLGDDEDADRAARHIKAGTMRTVSIGFRPKWDDVELIRDEEGRMTGLRFNAAELLECSLVPIPALPVAAMKELTTGMLSAETKELIQGILENFALKDGGVVNREELAGALREAEGNKTTVVVPKAEFARSFDLGLMPVGSTLKKNADGTVVLEQDGIVLAGAAKDDLLRHPDGTPLLRDLGTVRIKAQTPAGPGYIDISQVPAFSQKAGGDDGEGVPVAPNPADGEKAKTAAELALLPLSAIAGADLAKDVMAIVREEAAASGRSDSMVTRLLRHLLPFTSKSVPDEAPVKTDEEILAEAKALEVRKAAALAAASDIQAKAAPLLA